MNIFTRDLDFANFNYDEMSWIKFNGKLVFESFKRLLASGIPPLTLFKCKGVDLVDYKVYGESVQYGNIFNKDEMSNGFLPQTGEYPTTSSSYPNSKYMIIELKTGQTVDVTYTGSKDNAGRLRCIDIGINQVVQSVSAISNEYYTSTSAYFERFTNGTITAKKDFKLGVLFLSEFPDDFDLQIKTSMPTPSNPVEIESVGDKTRNLFDSSKVASSTIKVQDDGRTIIMPLNTSGNGYTYTGKSLQTLCPDLKVGDTVILNFKTTSPSRNVIYSSSLGSWFTGKTKTITQAMLDDSVALYGNNYSAGETEQVTITDFQIEKGTVVTDYEPYGYKVLVKVSGKNLCDINECLNEFAAKDEDGNIKLQNVFNDDGSVKKRYSEFMNVDFDADTYYFRAETLDYTTTTGNIQLQFRGESGTYYTKQITPSLGYNALVFTEKINAVRFYLNAADTGYVKFNKFQIAKETKLSDYEPYVKPTTTTIYLKQPLRKIGEYADYIDFLNWKIIRNIKYVEFDENEDWSKYTSVSNHYHTSVGDNYYGSNNYVVSNYYENHKMPNSYYSNKDYAVMGVDGGRIRFKNKDCATLEDWKSWISNLNEKLYVCYRLAEPHEEYIELPTISTIRGTTIIDVNTSIKSSNVEVEYLGKN